MTGEMFLAYVEQCLVPTLRRNDIVVMDNCRVHLVPGIREAIEKSGATLRYLPKYSPDLNPIELPYSKFKTFLRKVAARTVPRLNRAIRSFIPQLSPLTACCRVPPADLTIAARSLQRRQPRQRLLQPQFAKRTGDGRQQAAAGARPDGGAPLPRARSDQHRQRAPRAPKVSRVS